MIHSSRPLVVKKEVSIDDAGELIISLDVAMADYYCLNNDYKKGLDLYKEILSKSLGSERNMITDKYINHSLNYGQLLTKEQKWIEAVEIYRDFLVIQ